MMCYEHTAVKNDDIGGLAIGLKCKSWHCEHCAPGRRSRLIAEGMGGAPSLFLTMTIRRIPTRNADEAAKKLAWCWRVIRKRLMRHLKTDKLPFLAVFEAHKSGYPHLHILLRSRYLPIKLIRQWMIELCESPIQWIEKINNKKRAAGYCAKYCGKASIKFLFSKRYWQSQDYDLREPHREDDKFDDGEPWERRHCYLSTLADAKELEGFVVNWLDPHRLEWWSPI